MITILNSVTYSASDIDLLCKSIDTGYLGLPFFSRAVTYTIKTFYQQTFFTPELIHSMTLDFEIYKSFEPHGEAKYFSIYQYHNALNFKLEFWNRHLRKFLFEAQLKEMPLMLNVPFIKDLASWRLKIGK